ncbi:hypothetical protein J8273_0205 [Carpediemonas membranifera]|uniref:Uncharacterized protein n=1 Tax=Carpediemonas membranifera TaxID=201153 RepID=A0A8J6B8L7_9EUKA|nr:hypothetical protein J8273_0205 [Carpediemonas membranifera]|eukprot:KAG9394997.1 hypothetical protein J8273_0205 [Carpediemonas membranifera]
MPVERRGLALAMPSVVWAPAFLAATRQLAGLGVTRSPDSVTGAIKCLPPQLNTPSNWPSGLDDVKALDADHTQKNLVRLVEESIATKLSVSAAVSPNVVRSFMMVDPTSLGRSVTDAAVAPIFRNHLGLPAFTPGFDVCPLCRARTVNHQSVVCNATHTLCCPCLRGGLDDERHNAIKDGLVRDLKGYGWRVQSEVWLNKASEWTIDRTKPMKARADILLTKPGVKAIVIDNVVSNHVSQAMTSKRAQYSNWDVKLIPAVTLHNGDVGRVHGRGWTDDLRDELGLKAEQVREMADNAFLACMRGQVHTYAAFIKQCDAAHAAAEDLGLSH